MTTQSLFSATDRAVMLARIGRLTPTSKRQWGKMDVAQMCRHCQIGLLLAMGEMQLKRNLMGLLFGRLAKRSLVSPKPWRRGLPTAPEFRVTDQRDFTRERDALVALVERFGRGGPAVLTRHPHPFFGPMTTEEWMLLQWRHLDHHLQQFGA
ncbi:MAG: DUF1569 domain-containing protein [Planctomycetes bacterium]|nr:DUF1569 domain-containing protein [Planctomycetota bacterium]